MRCTLPQISLEFLLILLGFGTQLGSIWASLLRKNVTGGENMRPLVNKNNGGEAVSIMSNGRPAGAISQ